ncbi:endonuclease NucS domain-containing protein [Methanobacterium sp. SMA-27]|uniref:endonuclease NucS domain-containing protein n=1 Tax=Methanobacterium sp. SMA-27 TaxID=1495336 RepID=UPI000B327E81|nr:endonuclease NucS domain-containing protein [Methanobacterium sp. SMA-27]
MINKDLEVEEIIDESEFSKFGIEERKHMEEWITKYPQILGEELLTITTEYDKFDKTSNRLDILAVDKKGKIVVIELKRDVADRFVDLQAIHYASYCSNLNLEQVVDMMAEYKDESKEDMESELKEFISNEDFEDFDNQPRIMLVANDFREETLAAVLWLRGNDIDLTCIKLEPYKIENKIAIKPEIIMPLPEAKDFIIQVEQKSKSFTKKYQRRISLEEFLKSLDQQNKEFFEDLIEFVNENDLKINMGTVGFSVNVKLNGEPVSIFECYPPQNKKRNGIIITYTSILNKVKDAESVIELYKGLNSFAKNTGKGFIWNINTNEDREHLQEFKEVILNIIKKIEMNGLSDNKLLI